jgi:uncharacterized protein with ACT and thioredoxin-like domain
MDTIVNGSEIELEAPVSEEYGEEVMCAGWNPQITLVAESPVAQANKHVNLPGDLANVDVDTFLKRMYEYQC